MVWFNFVSKYFCLCRIALLPTVFLAFVENDSVLLTFGSRLHINI